MAPTEGALVRLNHPPAPRATLRLHLFLGVIGWRPSNFLCIIHCPQPKPNPRRDASTSTSIRIHSYHPLALSLAFIISRLGT